MTIHATPGELRLRLHLPAGRIEITTWDEPTTEVEVEPLSGGSEAAELAAEVRQQLRERAGGGHELVVESPGRKGILGFRREPELRFTIAAPHGTHIFAETASADLEGRGRFGTVELKTASGDLSVEEASGDVTVKTVSGDVNLSRGGAAARINTVSGDVHIGSLAGDAVVNLVSGDLDIGEAEASVGVKSVSGDVELGAVRRGEVRLQSVSGDLTIAIVPGARLWMDVSSLSGDTSSDLDVSDGTGDGGEVDLRVRASSTSGDIRLLRSQRASA
jgi:Putative adhesin